MSNFSRVSSPLEDSFDAFPEGAIRVPYDLLMERVRNPNGYVPFGQVPAYSAPIPVFPPVSTLASAPVSAPAHALVSVSPLVSAPASDHPAHAPGYLDPILNDSFDAPLLNDSFDAFPEGAIQVPYDLLMEKVRNGKSVPEVLPENPILNDSFDAFPEGAIPVPYDLLMEKVRNGNRSPEVLPHNPILRETLMQRGRPLINIWSPPTRRSTSCPPLCERKFDTFFVPDSPPREPTRYLEEDDDIVLETVPNSPVESLHPFSFDVPPTPEKTPIAKDNGNKSAKRRLFADNGIGGEMKKMRQESPIRADQYGGGGPRVFRKKTSFPTQDELDFFHANVSIGKEPTMKRQNAAYMAMEPVRIKFVNLEKIGFGSDLHYHMSTLFDIFIRMMIQKAKGNLHDTKFWFQLEHSGFSEKSGIVRNHLTYNLTDGGVIMNKLADVMQSNKEISIDEGFSVTMNVFSAKKTKKNKDMFGKGARKSEKIKNEILEINFGTKQNRVIGSSHCLPKALALGKLESDGKATQDEDEKKALKAKLKGLTRDQVSLHSREKSQLELAKQLLEDAGLPTDQKEHGRDDLAKLAAHLHDYQITLWAIEGRQTVASIVESLNPEGSRFIGLFYQGGHYEFVSHTVGVKSSRFCYKCSKFDEKHHNYRCKALCRRCGTTDCEPANLNIRCDKCAIHFRSQKCFDSHLKTTHVGAKPFCEKYFYCQKCHSIDRTPEYRKDAHSCGSTSFCFTCRKKKSEKHECSHPIPTEKDKEKKREKQNFCRVIVADLETITAESGEYQGYVERGPKHEVNLVCVEVFCTKCFGDDCDECPSKMHFSYRDKKIIRGSDDAKDDEDDEADESDEESEVGEIIPEENSTPLARFAEFLLNDPIANGAYVICHNGGRYDHVLILAELDRQVGLRAKEPKILLNGNTIITAEYTYKKQRLHFRDSLQYLTMPLSKMPAAFGLSGEAKGFFPHLYNHPDNYDKVLKTLPPREYYSPQFMKSETLAEFDEWYSGAYNDGFVLHDELLKYCESDVRILKLTLIAFIKKCQEIFNGWNPLVHGSTLASYIMFVLKHEYIKEGDVGVVPENGFSGGNNSALALKYIQWLEKKNPTLRLQYLLKGGEHRVKVNGHHYSVDGYDEVENEVYEVYGCLWHGCKKCQPIRDKKSPLCGGLTMEELWDRTNEREEDLKTVFKTVHTIWECEIYEEMEKDREMKKFFNLNKYTRRLLPREALYGGRTQAFRSLTKAEAEMILQYLDYVSMYPYLNAGGTAYPRGNPIVVERDFPNPDEPLKLRGLVYCDMLPPVDDPLAIMPQRFNQKLMFTLCRSCAEDQNVSGPCPHRNVSERYLTGVWCTDEINKAVSRGYKILKYHEIWYWKEKDWVAGGFFAKYIKPLLKLKYESSGWPKLNMTDAEKEAYIANIYEKDGILLDATKIQKNVAMRNLAKIFLNAAWGKFAQNSVKNEVRLIHKWDDVTLSNFFNDPKYEAVAMVPFGKKKLWISRKPKKETVLGTAYTNLAIAAITTSAARLRLTEAIERVGVENMIYCDTDSVMFRQKKDEDPLKDLKGEQLGFLVSEIPPGRELVEVVTMAPKVYALKIKKEDGTFEYSVKVKGVTMNSGNSRQITFDSMKKAMEDFISAGFTDPLEGEMLRFKRGDNALDGLWTCVMKKQLNPRMDKGHYVDGVATPFGLLPPNTPLIDDYPF